MTVCYNILSTATWKLALIAQPESPVGYGWSMADSELSPKLMTTQQHLGSLMN